MKKLIVLASASVAALCAAAANVWYVDDDNYGKEGLDGSTKEKAYGTIQDAIDAATAGDTIKVYPGTYDKGGADLVINDASRGYCRLMIKKKLTIESVEGAANTHIVGEWDPDTDTGRGPKAVRCIGQYSATTHVKGFTLRNGATNCELNSNGNEADLGQNSGGAVYSNLGDSPTYVVDCVVSNCNSSWGTFRNGCVIRSLICYNTGFKGVGGCQTTFYSSIITGNKSGGSLISDSNTSLSHCTVFGNATYSSVSKATTANNNIIFNSFTNPKDDATDLSGEGDATLSNNVLGREHGEYHMIAPGVGDFRVLKGSVAETICAGCPDDGSGLVRAVPEEYQGKDFYGNPITENCVAGAVQGVAEAVGGELLFDGITSTKGVSIDGWHSVYPRTYVFPVSYPTQYQVKAVLKSGKLFAWDTTTEHGNFHLPDWKSDTVYLMPPPQKNVAMTNTMIVAAGEIWLDPEKGNDEEGAGTKALPYRTLQKGADASVAYTFIYCKNGTYSDGGGAVHWGVKNRVLLSGSRAVRFVAVDGTDSTFIEGEPDLKHNGVRSGCGSEAMRAICVKSGSPISAFEGFTIRNSFTDSQEEGEKNTEGFQGAVFRTTSDSFTLMDCVVSNCASASSVFCNGRLIRCRVTGMQNISQPCDATIVSGCLFEDNASSDRGASGIGAHVTLRNSGGMLRCYGCIASGGTRVNRTYAGSIMHDFVTYSVSGGYSTDDPCFASTTGAEILRSSPAFTCGEVPTADNYGTNYYKYATTDFFGRRLMFIDGKPVAGADHMGLFSMFWKRGFTVAPASGRVLEDGEGCVTLPEGESISIAKEDVADAADRRRCVLRFVVPEGGSFSVKAGDEEYLFAPGLHEFVLGSLKDGIGETVLESKAGTIHIASVRYVSGTVVSLR